MTDVPRRNVSAVDDSGALLFCLTLETGFDECWECGGSATLGGSQDAVPGINGGRFCSTECADGYDERAQREREKKAALCNICDSPPGECVTEFQDIDGTMTPWLHEYEPRGLPAR